MISPFWISYSLCQFLSWPRFGRGGGGGVGVWQNHVAGVEKWECQFSGYSERNRLNPIESVFRRGGRAGIPTWRLLRRDGGMVGGKRNWIPVCTVFSRPLVEGPVFDYVADIKRSEFEFGTTMWNNLWYSERWRIGFSHNCFQAFTLRKACRGDKFGCQLLESDPISPNLESSDDKSSEITRVVWARHGYRKSRTGTVHMSEHSLRFQLCHDRTHPGNLHCQEQDGSFLPVPLLLSPEPLATIGAPSAQPIEPSDTSDLNRLVFVHWVEWFLALIRWRWMGCSISRLASADTRGASANWTQPERDKETEYWPFASEMLNCIGSRFRTWEKRAIFHGGILCVWVQLNFEKREPDADFFPASISYLLSAEDLQKSKSGFEVKQLKSANLRLLSAEEPDSRTHEERRQKRFTRWVGEERADSLPASIGKTIFQQSPVTTDWHSRKPRSSKGRAPHSSVMFMSTVQQERTLWPAPRTQFFRLRHCQTPESETERCFCSCLINPSETFGPGLPSGWKRRAIQRTESPPTLVIRSRFSEFVHIHVVARRCQLRSFLNSYGFRLFRRLVGFSQQMKVFDVKRVAQMI